MEMLERLAGGEAMDAAVLPRCAADSASDLQQTQLELQQVADGLDERFLLDLFADITAVGFGDVKHD